MSKFRSALYVENLLTKIFCALVLINLCGEVSCMPAVLLLTFLDNSYVLKLTVCCRQFKHTRTYLITKLFSIQHCHVMASKMIILLYVYSKKLH